MQHGMSGASAHGYACLGFILGPVFHRYGEGYRFAKLACDLVEKHGFIAYQAKVYHAMGMVAFWTQPIATAIDFMRAAFRTAIETGDLTFACYGMYQSVTDLLLRNDPLDAVWRESEMALDFARKAKFGDVADIIREPATLHRDHAGPDRDLLHLQRRAVRRGGVRGATDRRIGCPDDLLVLDPQTEGAVPVGRLRRGSRGSRQGEAAPFGRSRLRSSYSTTFTTPR